MRLLIYVFFLFINSSCQNKTHTIKKVHEQTKRFCIGKTYMVTNSYGSFSVCIQEHLDYDETGIASFYTMGEITATQDAYKPYENFTAAHPYLPIPCIAEVSLCSNPKRKIKVKINDRGPFVKQKRIIDLSYAAAKDLGILKAGLAKVRVRVLVEDTYLLKEYGGPIDWDGKGHFDTIKKTLKPSLKKNQPSKNPKKKKH